MGAAAVIYNGTTYYYLRNAMGDITGIVDSTGAQVVSYTYDAWGKLLGTAGTMAATLGQDNPLRYRGYIYDGETGLYYLTSRYYNPEWCRSQIGAELPTREACQGRSDRFQQMPGASGSFGQRRENALPP